MKLFGSTLLLVFAFMLAACGKKKSAVAEPSGAIVVPVTSEVPKEINSNEKDTFLIYERGACFGMCPIFDLVVYRDGKAVYEGKNFVDMIGFYQTKMDAAVLQKVMEQAEAINYFGLQPEYDNPNVTDLPTTVTGISKDGKLKIVANRYKGPANLKLLYNELDKIIGEQKWEPMNK